MQTRPSRSRSVSIDHLGRKMGSQERGDSDVVDVEASAKSDAGGFLRRWLGGFWGGIGTVLPFGTAILGSALFYSAKVSERYYLKAFGLRADQFGNGTPDISVMVIPALFFASWLVLQIYRGAVIKEESYPKVNTLIDAIILRGDGRTIAARLILFMAMIPVLIVFPAAHLLSSSYGSCRANSVIYRVGNRACADDCTFYQVSSFGPKKVAVGELGIPIVGGEGVTALSTNRGTVIIKLEEVKLIAPQPNLGAKAVNTSAFGDLKYRYLCA